jgi:hypothetical protein
MKLEVACMTEEENNIEWKDVKDNLRIIEIDEEHLVNLGNPFQEQGPRIPRTAPVRDSGGRPASRLYLVLVAILIVSTGFFFLRSLYTDSVIDVSENWKADFRLEVVPPVESQTYRLEVQVHPECNMRSLRVRVNDEQIKDDHGTYVYELKIPPEKVLKVDFYVDSSLFGKRTLNSVVIIPFQLKFDEKVLTVKNDSRHRFLIYTLQDNRLVLQPQESFRIPIVTPGEIVIVATDLENFAEFKVVIQVGGDHGTEA